MKTAGIVAIALTAGAIGAGAAGWLAGSRAGPVVPARVPATPASVRLGSVMLGDAPLSGTRTGALTDPNPYGEDPAAIAEGKRLYRAMNCAGCHGYKGEGNMGPPLNDAYWRYGGAPMQIYKTLFDGRPQGMPAWGAALPPDQLWKITAYVSSLGGGVKPADALTALHGDQGKLANSASHPNGDEGGSSLEGQ